MENYHQKKKLMEEETVEETVEESRRHGGLHLVIRTIMEVSRKVAARYNLTKKNGLKKKSKSRKSSKKKKRKNYPRNEKKIPNR
jgi:hypothetical protein